MSLGGKLIDETDTFILRPPCLPSPTIGSARGRAPALLRAGSDWPGLHATPAPHPQPLADSQLLPAAAPLGSTALPNTVLRRAQVDLARIVTLNHLEKTDYIKPEF